MTVPLGVESLAAGSLTKHVAAPPSAPSGDLSALRRGWTAAVSHSPMAWALIGFIRLWRLIISPLYGDVCKFYPTCSSYGLTAVETHGAVKGSWLIVRRLVRCHPWSMGGYDPVPGAHSCDAAHDSDFPSQGEC